MDYRVNTQLEDGHFMKYVDECVQCGKKMLDELDSRTGGYFQMEKDENGDTLVLSLCWPCSFGEGHHLMESNESLKNGQHFQNSQKE